MLKRVMKISSAAFDALFTPELNHLSKLFRESNYELRMAGGAVRDLLMGLTPNDVDFASTATPTQMKDLFEQHGVRMLHKRGEEHGTITCRINDKENFEITTLRIDVVCDGRRAEVKFTTDWHLDAFRRDLTVNSLFLGLDGIVYDYTGGIADIEKRRIAFVGDPVQRLQEDYLRILRYFRFFGRISKCPNQHESENINAIIKCRDGLKNVSGERIWTELNKIVVGRFAAEVIEEMLIHCKLGPLVGLNGFDEHNHNDTTECCKLSASERVAEFKRVAAANVSHDTGKLTCLPATALAALLASPAEANDFRERVKFSNAEQLICEFIVAHRDNATQHRNDLKFFQYIVLDLIFYGGNEIKDLALQQCIQLLKYIGAHGLVQQIADWNVDQFPISGLLLMEHKVEKGPRMRAVMQHLFNLWKKSDLQLSKVELLEHVNDAEEIESILAEMQQKRNDEPRKKKRRHAN